MNFGVEKDKIWSRAFEASHGVYLKEYSDGTLSYPSMQDGENPWNLLVHSGYREQFWNSAQSLIGINQDLGDLVTKGLTASIKFSWDAVNTNTIVRSKTPNQYYAALA